MKFEFFTAKRFIVAKDKRSLSSVFFKIAVVASVVSVVVMILTVGILDGFKKSLIRKLVGVSSHIIVSKHVADNSYNLKPIKREQEIIDKLSQIPGIRNIQTFAIKPGLIKTKTETFGVVLKGIDERFDWNSFADFMVRGRKLIVSNGSTTGKEIVISEALARKIKADTGDFVYMYFLDSDLRTRKYQIVGIYNTNLMEIDQLYVFADISDVQRLNNWNYFVNQDIAGYEIFIDNINELDRIAYEVYKSVGFRFDIKGEKLNVYTVRELYPAIFDWMSLLNLNSLILLIIMTVIVSINMITSLLILILDKTQQIGILKVVGANNRQIRRIFVINGINILLKGLFWGNFIGISIALVQKYTHILPLDPQMYYINYVPIELDIVKVLVINVFLIVLTFFVLLFPSLIISKISPAKVLKFD